LRRNFFTVGQKLDRWIRSRYCRNLYHLKSISKRRIDVSYERRNSRGIERLGQRRRTSKEALTLSLAEAL